MDCHNLSRACGTVRFLYSVIMNSKNWGVEPDYSLYRLSVAEQSRTHIRQTCEQPPCGIVRHRREYILIAVKFTGGERTDGDADRRQWDRAFRAICRVRAVPKFNVVAKPK